MSNDYAKDIAELQRTACVMALRRRAERPQLGDDPAHLEGFHRAADLLESMDLVSDVPHPPLVNKVETEDLAKAKATVDQIHRELDQLETSTTPVEDIRAYIKRLCDDVEGLKAAMDREDAEAEEWARREDEEYAKSQAAREERRRQDREDANGVLRRLFDMTVNDIANNEPASGILAVPGPRYGKRLDEIAKLEDGWFPDQKAIPPETIAYARKMLSLGCTPSKLAVDPETDGTIRVEGTYMRWNITCTLRRDDFTARAYPPYAGYDHMDIEVTGSSPEEWFEFWKRVQ